MHFATHVRSLLRMTDTMTSQNIDISSWDTLYSPDTDTQHTVSRIVRQFKSFRWVKTSSLSTIIFRHFNPEEDSKFLRNVGRFCYYTTMDTVAPMLKLQTSRQ
jgi:hypothetical protein